MKLFSAEDVSSIESSEHISWNEVKRVALRNWQLSIVTKDKRKDLFLQFSQSQEVEEFIRSEKNISWSSLRTKYWIVLLSLTLIIFDMALLVLLPISWTIVGVGACLMALSFGLIIYAVMKPRMEDIISTAP